MQEIQEEKGLEGITTLKQINPETPIILCTQDNDIVKGLLIQANVGRIEYVYLVCNISDCRIHMELFFMRFNSNKCYVF